VVGRAAQGADVIRKAVRVVDQRTGTAPFLRKALRYVFPDHWSFLLGEVALYSFIVLVATGIYLTFFFDPSTERVVYHGPYEPLQGVEMSRAYQSVVQLSLQVKAGLLIRQMHHWAANVFVVAIVLHLLRIFFTGAFRKPRELTYYIGLTMLALSLLEGYLGYSLADDLLSGMGLAIGYAVALSIPFVGGNLALLIWDGEFPGSQDFWPRMYATHVLFLPVAIGVLIGLHLFLVASRHHTQFQGPRKTQRKVIGTPTVPGQAPRSLGLMAGVASLLFLLGGLVQINPVWLWGPYETGLSTNGAQPDWYLGWLIGGLRLMPPWEPHAWGYTFVPNPFWGGVTFPLVVFGTLFAWPTIERRLTGDRGFHNILDRPRDAPHRTAFGLAFVSWVVLVFFFGSADRVTVFFGLSYVNQLYAYWVVVWVLPVLVYAVTLRVCRGVQRKELVDAEQERAEAEARAATAPEI